MQNSFGAVSNCLFFQYCYCNITGSKRGRSNIAIITLIENEHLITQINSLPFVCTKNLMELGKVTFV